MIERDEVLGHIHNLPTFPAAVSRLSSLIGDPSTNAADLEDAIRPDPALTANLLRLANSAHFGLARSVGSVRQAVTLLGTKQVFELAASAAFTRVIPPRLPGYGIGASEFWLHSVAVAILAERIAALARRKVPDMTFTAGLLHDVGKLVVGASLMESPDGLREGLQKEGAVLVDAERSLLPMDHGEIGEAVADRWNLPRAIALAARWHHSPAGVPEGSYATMIDIVHTADCLAHALGFGADVGELSRRIDGGVLRRLQVPVFWLESCASDSVDAIREMGELISKKAGV